MEIAYTHRTQLTTRILILLSSLTFIGLFITAITYLVIQPMSVNAYPILKQMIKGEFSQLINLSGFLVTVTFCYGLSCLFLSVATYNALLKPNQVVTLDFDNQQIRMSQQRPLGKIKNYHYDFADINYLELENENLDSGGERLKLHLNNLKEPILLSEIYGYSQLGKYSESNGFIEYKKLISYGIPAKLES